MPETPMDLHARLIELARISRTPTPMVSVYLNTRWADEHQRERVRLFLKNEIRRARPADASPALEADLEWIQSQAERLIDQDQTPEADGVALFACQALGLREVLPVRLPFENTLVVADAPYLRPLASLLGVAPPTLVVFLDAESARLVPLSAQGAGEEVVLESEVPGHHRRGGWAQLAQSRYQRHIQDHRGRHFEAVAKTLLQLLEEHGLERIVMAGEPRNLAVFREHIPPPVATLIVGSVSAARYENASAMASRAAALLASLERSEEAVAVDSVLVEAAKRGRAVAGLDATLEAVDRAAVRRLYLLESFTAPGRVCGECGALQSGSGPACRFCGKATRPVELGEAMVDAVLAAGGQVTTVEIHEGLTRAGGVAALLRYGR